MKKLIFTRVEQIHLLSNIVISHLKYDLKFRKLGTKKLFLNAIKAVSYTHLDVYKRQVYV